MQSLVSWTISLSSLLIALSVWATLTFYSRRSRLTPPASTRFSVVLGIYLFGWLGLAFALGGLGVFQATPTRAFPALGIGLGLPIFVGTLLLHRSATLAAVVAAVPLAWLVGIQFYRILGLIFLIVYWQAGLPEEFALPAGWGDVVVGLAAPLVAYFLYKGQRWSCIAALGWNLLGVLDLIVAVGTGFLSSPGPFQQLALDNPNEMITAFPLVMVPLFAVPVSILLHLAALEGLKHTQAASEESILKGVPHDKHCSNTRDYNDAFPGPEARVAR